MNYMIRPEAIHRRFHETRDERARLLWNICLGHLAGNPHIFEGPYLDIGAGNLSNASFFARSGVKNAVGVDIRADLAKTKHLALVRADAHALPFRDRTFELVTMFSVIEHVREQLVCLSEAFRVLRSSGFLFLQLPNRNFPIEFHSGLYAYFYLPRCLRGRLADAAGLGWMKAIDIPSVENTTRMLRTLEPGRRVLAYPFSYSEYLLPESRWIRAFYRILLRLNLLSVLPMSYMVIAQSALD